MSSSRTLVDLEDVSDNIIVGRKRALSSPESEQIISRPKRRRRGKQRNVSTKSTNAVAYHERLSHDTSESKPEPENTSILSYRGGSIDNELSGDDQLPGTLNENYLSTWVV